MALPDVSPHHPIHWRAEQNKRQRKEEFLPFFPASVLELAFLIFLPQTRIYIIGSCGSQAFGWDWTTPLAFLGLEPIPVIKLSHVYISVYNIQ